MIFLPLVPKNKKKLQVFESKEHIVEFLMSIGSMGGNIEEQEFPQNHKFEYLNHGSDL
jgi:hypothetical protein